MPLLEFVLTGLWQARRAGQLTHEAYQSMGGVQGAMAQRAEQVRAALGPKQEMALRQVFLQLVRPGTGTEDTRRRASLDHFGGAVQPAIQQLAKERLLVTGRDEASGKETVEVAHEALIQHWARLRQWLDADREFLTWRERLEAALGEWERTSRKDAGTLLRGAPLAEAEHWLSERADDLTEDERTYIQASVRARNRSRWLVRGSIAVALLASVAVGIWQYLEAEQLRRELERGTYEPGPYRLFKIYERKPRVIAAAPFRDRVVHHAVMNLIEPPLDRGFIADSYACRQGKGVHAAVDRYQAWARRYTYALKLDVAQYFPSIDHALLKAKLRHRIKDPRVLALLDRIIDTSPTAIGTVERPGFGHRLGNHGVNPF